MVKAEFETIWQAVEAAKERGESDPDDKGKSEDELKLQYMDIATRRVRLGLLLAELGRQNNIESSQEELNRSIQEYAMRYPGQEQQVFEHLRNNPQEAERLRGPIVEDKVVDYLLEIVKVSERNVSQEELTDETEKPIGASPDKSKKTPKKSKKKNKKSATKGS